jgi:hypothetical protein
MPNSLASRRTHTTVNVVLADRSKHTSDQYAPHVSSRLSSDRRCPRHYADFRVLDVALPGGDVIYGMPYLAAVNPSINWKSRTITLATPNGPLDIHSRNTQPLPRAPKGSYDPLLNTLLSVAQLRKAVTT